MLQPQELRIGNWIRILNSERECKIEDADDFLYVLKHEDCYEGIPLTPEILERCGFTIGSSDIDSFYHGLLYVHLKFDCDSWTVLVGEDYIASFPIKYLHQLQNLYYLLTGGKELQYNPK